MKTLLNILGVGLTSLALATETNKNSYLTFPNPTNAPPLYLGLNGGVMVVGNVNYIVESSSNMVDWVSFPNGDSISTNQISFFRYRSRNL